MNAFLDRLWHGVATGMPYGVALGTLLVWTRLAAVDYRQWFRDPGRPIATADDSWIGLALADLRTSSAAPIVPLFLLGVCAGWRGCAATLGCTLGILLGAILAQGFWEGAWRFGLAVVPDALPPEQFLSTVAPGEPPITLPRNAAGHRRLIICCDGTWNWPDGKKETNVVRLLRLIKAEATSAQGPPIPQITHYHVGVGTGNFLDRIVGGVGGIGLSNSVKACYGFLVDNYMPGDEIHLFGFSRGAFVARSVAGMVNSVGLLKRWEMVHFAAAWKWYTEAKDGRPDGYLAQIAPERDTSVDIECIGVWDTVGALGIPGTRFCTQSFAFHQTELGDRVRHAFQALAMDERRGNFQAAVWGASPDPKTGQVLEQVWFPGAHSNVGGGYKQHGMSDTALLWMLSRIEHYGLLALDLSHLDSALDKTEPYPGGILVDSRSWVWRLVGSPCPRPIGLTSTSERIHSSAFDRATSAAIWRKKDPYREPARVDWLNTMAVYRQQRCAFEINHAVQTAGKNPPPPTRIKTKKQVGICDWVMRQLEGER